MTTDDSSYKKIKSDLYLLPKCGICAEFELSRLLGGLARECDVQTDRQTDRRQVKTRLRSAKLNSAELGVFAKFS